jgi:hypothetical protein
LRRDESKKRAAAAAAAAADGKQKNAAAAVRIVFENITFFGSKTKQKQKGGCWNKMATNDIPFQKCHFRDGFPSYCVSLFTPTHMLNALFKCH